MYYCDNYFSYCSSIQLWNKVLMHGELTASRLCGWKKRKASRGGDGEYDRVGEASMAPITAFATMGNGV